MKRVELRPKNTLLEAMALTAPMREGKDAATHCTLCGAPYFWQGEQGRDARLVSGVCQLPPELRAQGFQCEVQRMNWSAWVHSGVQWHERPLEQRPPIRGTPHPDDLTPFGDCL